MKFLSILSVSALAFLGVQAQSTSGTEVTSAAVPTSSADAAFLACLNACDPADTGCRARCSAVPSPNQQQANDTITCVAACPQGNGTAADIQTYITCRDGCIGQNYYTTDGTPSPTGTSSNGDDDNSDSPSGTDSDDPSNTGSGSGNEDSGNGDAPGAASSLFISSSVGILGLFAAMIAL